MSSKIFYLWYDSDEGRYHRSTYGFHCGDCLEVRTGGAWIQTRIEHTSSSTHSHGWYLVTHPEMPLDDLAVKEAA